VKQPPHLARAQGRMAPGVITLDGFLGPDPRELIEILQDDDGVVHRLGLSHREVADALERLTHRAVEALGSPVRDGVYELQAEESRGGLPCPFGHAGLFDKTVVEARRVDTGQTLTWSALHVHLIGEHGFYEGRGSVFRLEPAVLAKFLGLEARGGSAP
jgi:hypothetical protein